MKYNIGDYVFFNKLYSSSYDDKGIDPIYNDGRIVRIWKTAKNPYELCNNNGFINDECITGFVDKTITKEISENVSKIILKKGAYNLSKNKPIEDELIGIELDVLNVNNTKKYVIVSYNHKLIGKVSFRYVKDSF